MGSAWKKVKTAFGTTEYHHVSGARVYNYGHKAFKGTEWGVQMGYESKGDGGFENMREAKAYVERHAA